MSPPRRLLAASLLLWAAFGCGSLFGPDLDGPAFADLKINDRPQRVTQIIDGTLGGTPGFGFLADYSTSDGGSYEIGIYLSDFHGRGTYGIASDDDHHQLFIAGQDAQGDRIQYRTAAGQPGKVMITQYRESDRTATGLFVAQVIPVAISGNAPSGAFDISGSFRIHVTRSTGPVRLERVQSSSGRPTRNP